MLSSTWFRRRYWVCLFNRGLHTGIDLNSLCEIWCCWILNYLMLEVLFWLNCAIGYFEASVDGDSGTEFKV